jgi:hypothetical protein
VVISSFVSYYPGELMMGGDVLVATFDTCRYISGWTRSDVTLRLPNKGFDFLNIKTSCYSFLSFLIFLKRGFFFLSGNIPPFRATILLR